MRLSPTEFALIILLALAATFSAAQSGTSEDVVMTTLPNGLTVAVKEYHNAPVVTLKIFVKMGGVYEEEYLGCGMSHYCEHLVSGGTTPKRTEEEAKQIIRNIGAQVNAYTSSDHTCYYMHCSSRDWEAALDLLSDWVMNCTMDSAEVAREKGVITREINMGEDEPGRVIYKLTMKTVFPNAPLGVPTIGYRDDFLRVSREELMRFYHKYYVPNNTVLVVVGDVDAHTVLEKTKELMDGWERRPLFKSSLPVEPTQVAERRVNKEWPGEMVYLRLAWPTIRLTDPDLYALDLLAGVLGNGRSSILYRSLKEEKGLVFDIGVFSYTPSFGPGAFVVHARLPEGSVEEAVDAIREKIEETRTKLVPEKQLERAKTQIIAEYSFGRQSCNDMASAIGRDLVSTGDPYFSRRYAERIERVAARELTAIATTYLLPERLSIVMLNPEPSEPPEALETATEVAQAGIARTILPNGLRLLTKTNPNVDVVSIYAAFLGGTRYETDGTNGLFSLMSRCMRRGTKKHDAAEIVTMVEGKGGTLESGASKDFFWVRLDLLAKDVDFGVRLLGELLTEAAFHEEEIERQKTELLAELQEQENDWQREALQFYLSTFFSAHPYHLNTLGDKQVVESLTGDDLTEAYRSFVTAESGVVAVFGNVDAGQVEQAARKHLASIAPGSCPPPPPAELSLRDTLHRATKINEKGQVTICLGYPAPSLGHEDEYSLRLMDAITSGVHLPSGWLHEALRGRNNLVYFIHLIPIFFNEAGTMVILTQCQPDLADSVLSIIEVEMDKARDGAFTEDEMRAARAQCITATSLYNQTMADQAERITRFELFGLGYETAAGFETKITEATMDDVQEAARTYLRGGVLTLAGPLENAD